MVFRLKKGDLIDILAPGSFIDEDENFQKGIGILKNWGLEINENNSLSKKFGYFAGDDLAVANLHPSMQRKTTMHAEAHSKL